MLNSDGIYNPDVRISLVNSLCSKIVSGTDKDRQAKLKSIFEFGMFSIMRNDIYDNEGKSIGIENYIYYI